MLPFSVCDPITKEPVKSESTLFGKTIHTMVVVLSSGWANKCCTNKHAYQVSFPTNITREKKAVLNGSTLLVNVTMYKKQEASNNN